MFYGSMWLYLCCVSLIYLFLSVCLPVCLSVFFTIYLPTYLPTVLSVCLYVCVCTVYLHLYIFVWLAVHMIICFVSFCLHLSSVYLSFICASAVYSFNRILSDHHKLLHRQFSRCWLPGRSHLLLDSPGRWPHTFLDTWEFLLYF